MAIISLKQAINRDGRAFWLERKHHLKNGSYVAGLKIKKSSTFCPHILDISYKNDLYIIDIVAESNLIFTYNTIINFIILFIKILIFI